MTTSLLKANDAPWTKLFQELRIVEAILEQNYFDITSTQINKYREARLMTKIDSRGQLSPVFKENGLGILAISNGTYRIARIDPFIDVQPIAKEREAKRIHFPNHINTIVPERITTESQALDAANVSGILNEVFGEETDLTIRGRISVTNPFKFTCSQIPFEVNGVQIETDGGYEGKGLHLVEAKIGKPDSVSIRQLLYPEYYWKQRVLGKKVRSYALIYDAPILRFIPVAFDAGDKGQLVWAEEKAFTFFKKSDLVLNFAGFKVKPDLINQSAPFPQADDFDRVLRMLDLIGQGVNTKQGLLEGLAEVSDKVVGRQIDYYFACLNWMRLATSEKGVVLLTTKGEEVYKLPFDEKIYMLAETIFADEAFNAAVRYGIDASTGVLARKLGGSTVRRRQQTISAWIAYFNNLKAHLS